MSEKGIILELFGLEQNTQPVPPKAEGCLKALCVLATLREINFKQMKQTSDQSEQAIRQLSDKLSEIITEAHTTMIEMSAKFQVWSQILNR